MTGISSHRGRAVRFGLASLGALSLGTLGGALYTAWSLNAPRRPDLDYAFTPFEVGLAAEDVELRSSDGVTLRGWWFAQEEDPDAPVIICCHGHRGTKSDLLGIGPALFRAGNSVLLFDFRGCGDSADGPQSLAHNEQRDLEAAIDWVRRVRPTAPIGVLGFSMGASVAALVTARRSEAAAVALDSPFASMRDVVAAGYRRLRLPSWLLLDAADLATRVRYGYAFAQVAPIDVIGRIAPRPLMLLHGSADRIIPVSHSEQLFAAAGDPKELIVFPGADHCGGYFADRPGYVEVVSGFFTRHLR